MNDTTSLQRAVRGALKSATLVMGVAWVAASLSLDAAAGTSVGSPLLRQITNITTGTLGPPKLRLERAETIAFVSDGDVLGPDTATAQREVYLYDTVADHVAKLTNSSGGESYDVAHETDETHSGRPKYVAFVSSADLDPSVGNPEHNPEIFLAITDTGTISQITKTAAGVVNAEPYASDSGECLVFRSNGNLNDNDGTDSANPGAGYRNEDGSDEVFMLHFDNADLSKRVVTQVSNGPAGTTSSNPVVGGFWFTRQCRSTVYQSDYDQLQSGSTGTHIYNFTKTNGRTEQLSKPGAGDSRDPAITGASSFARGPFVVFESDADMLGNGPTGNEIYRHRIFRFELFQFTLHGPGESRHPVISDGGGVLAFESTAELIDGNRAVRGGTPPFNADGNSEIFRTQGRRKVWQLTQTQGCQNTFPSIQDNGRSVAFLSTCDLIPGLNPNGLPQIFLYQDVKDDDPRQTNCRTSEGCCNEANGCYHPLRGSQDNPPHNRLLRSWF